MANYKKNTRVAIFSHDSYGIGHVRRCMNIIQGLANRQSDITILFITGTPPNHLFEFLPQNADILKIPTIVTSTSTEDRPPTLTLSLPELSLMRSRLIEEAVIQFEPDVFLVDNFPLGSRRELLPVLKRLRRESTETVLGLRDIVDPPEKVKKDWSRDGIYEALDRYYKRILVYGMQEVFDVVEEYELGNNIAEKVCYCGYVISDNYNLETEKKTLDELNIEEPYAVATVGGGADGLPVLNVFIKAIKRLSIPAIIIAGPRMSISDRNYLRSSVADMSVIKVLDYVKYLPDYLKSAGVVVSMAGYNTLTEVIAHNCKSIVIPRTWYSGEHSGNGLRTDLEQLIRAKSLDKLGLVNLIEPKELSPDVLADNIDKIIRSRKKSHRFKMNFSGLENCVDYILGITND